MDSEQIYLTVMHTLLYNSAMGSSQLCMLNRACREVYVPLTVIVSNLHSGRWYVNYSPSSVGTKEPLKSFWSFKLIIIDYGDRNVQPCYSRGKGI